MKVVIAGVSGSGKSTIGELLAKKTGAAFLDADDFHPPENIRKMHSGIPLNDDDRAGWIESLGKELEMRPKVILACSALKKVYRERLRAWEPETRFVLLELDRQDLVERLAARVVTGHFMSPALLDSQLATLETGNDVTAVKNNRTPGEVVQDIIATLHL